MGVESKLVAYMSVPPGLQGESQVTGVGMCLALSPRASQELLCMEEMLHGVSFVHSR